MRSVLQFRRSSLTAAAILFAAALAGPAPGASAFVSLTPPRPALGTEALSVGENPEVAYDGNGGWGVVFIRAYDVYFSKTADGFTWTTPVALTTGADITRPPVLVRESGGAWIAAWIRSGFTFVGTLEFARSADGGATWTTGTLAGPFTLHGYGYTPGIAADGAGNAVVVYTSSDDPAAGTGVQSKFVRSGDGGSTWSLPGLLDPDPGYFDSFTTVTVASNGDWLAAWVDVETIVPSSEFDVRIRGARSTDGGTTWSAPLQWTPTIRINTTLAGDQQVHRMLRIHAGPGGTVVLAWQRQSSVHYARSPDSANTWSAESSLGPMEVLGLDHRPLAIDTDEAGRWIVVWWSTHSGDATYATYGGDHDLFHSRSDDDGLTWTASEPVNLDAEDVLVSEELTAFERSDVLPSLASDRNGDWLFAWMISGGGMVVASSQCWQCTGIPLICSPDDGSACDDGDVCTLASSCSAGTCQATSFVEAEPVCRWALIAGADAEDGRLKMTNRIIGDVCTATGRLGDVAIRGHLVATSADGTKGLIVKGAAATLYKHVVTGGSGIRQTIRGGSLPGTGLGEIAPGSIVTKYPQGVYDTTGTHDLVAQCLANKNAIEPLSALLDSLPATMSVGDIKTGSGQDLMLMSPLPGALNVLEVDRLRIGRGSTVSLDGGGDPSTVLIVRIDRTVKMANGATLALTGGLTAERTLLYVRGKRFATSRGTATGAGAVVSATAKVRLGGTTTWVGAIATGGRSVVIGDSAKLMHAPFVGF